MVHANIFGVAAERSGDTIRGNIPAPLSNVVAQGKFMRNKKSITTKEFDEKFEHGKDVSEHIEWFKATKRVPLDLSLSTICELDSEAACTGLE